MKPSHLRAKAHGIAIVIIASAPTCAQAERCRESPPICAAVSKAIASAEDAARALTGETKNDIAAVGVAEIEWVTSHRGSMRKIVYSEVARILSCDMHLAPSAAYCNSRSPPSFPTVSLDHTALISGDLCPDQIPADFTHDPLCTEVTNAPARAVSRNGSEVTVSIGKKMYIVDQSRVSILCGEEPWSVGAFEARRKLCAQ